MTAIAAGANDGESLLSRGKGASVPPAMNRRLSVSVGRKTIYAIAVLLAAAVPIAPAHALSCRFSVDNLNFGTIDVLDGSTPTVGGTVTVRCRCWGRW